MSDYSFSVDFAENCNIINQVPVSDLLDGRYFFIPSYQRGYRWTKKQIYDLCNDLLEYCLKKDKKEGSFYSLQPLIVRKGTYFIDGQEIDQAYEVIDGQQRLTSIFILYRFLANRLRFENIQDVADNYGQNTLYHIFYETRPNDYHTLEKSGFSKIVAEDITDIDIAHISNAYQYLAEWVDNENDKDCATAMVALHDSPKNYPKKTICNILFDLLNNTNCNGSVQFIWYELSSEKDAIKEFLCENKGKIRLTDTEKIRALIMQRSNFGTDANIKNLKQLSIAKDWELIENTLHKNDFWSFISKDVVEDGRINIIFKYIYEQDNNASDLIDNEDYLYRYFNKEFSLKKKDNPNETIASHIDELWNRVMECFRMLQNWYNNPRIYNLVGLLIKHGHSIKRISDIYNQEDVITNEDFIIHLNKEVRREIIDKVEILKGQSDLDIEADEEYINLFFNISAHKAKMHDLFRFLNVWELNKAINKALDDINKSEDEKKQSDVRRSDRDILSHIYRFPFDALDVFGWDIEHVDSATTNSLNDPKEQYAWLKEAITVIPDIIPLEDLNNAFNNPSVTEKSATLKRMVDKMREVIKEDESEICKNWIGNLTLLDSGTNRAYQNMIFAWKGNYIKQRIKAGIFVPICTQNIFSKSYEGCSEGRITWNLQDKKAYHAYMLGEIKAYRNKYADSAVEADTQN